MIDEMEIRLSMRAVEEEHACVIVCAPAPKDTIKVGNAKHYAVDTPDRSCLWAVQTPQSFSYELLMEAYGEMWQAAESGERITDDAMIVERLDRERIIKSSLFRKIREYQGHNTGRFVNCRSFFEKSKKNEKLLLT